MLLLIELPRPELILVLLLRFVTPPFKKLGLDGKGIESMIPFNPISSIKVSSNKWYWLVWESVWGYLSRFEIFWDDNACTYLVYFSSFVKV